MITNCFSTLFAMCNGLSGFVNQSCDCVLCAGTIGHVAHGKSTVVKALSGVQVSTDRNMYVQGSTLAVFRYPEHPRFSDGIPDSPEQ